MQGLWGRTFLACPGAELSICGLVAVMLGHMGHGWCFLRTLVRVGDEDKKRISAPPPPPPAKLPGKNVPGSEVSKTSMLRACQD